jgi:hypothetical protein
MRIDDLEIDHHIVDKIESKHGMTFTEVEEASFSRYRHVRGGGMGCISSLVRQTRGGTSRSY